MLATQAADILEEIDRAWREFRSALDRVPAERMLEEGVVDSWSVKDLIGHITTWENEMVRCVRGYLESDDLRALAFPDVDAFNERTVADKKTTPLGDLLGDLERTHEEAVQFLSDMPMSALGVSEVVRRIRIDTWEHYEDHTQGINAWTG